MSDAGSAPARYRRILVTGGTGFVGGHLCPRLRETYPQARRVLLTRPGEETRRAGFEAAAIDLLDRTAVAAVVAREKPDLVVHLAAQASVGALRSAAVETWRVNVEATLHLAAAIAAHAPTTTMLFVSSAEVYGASFRDGPVDETTPPQPLNAYARTKLAAEMALTDLLPQEATLLVARAFNHTGAGQDTRFVLPAFAAQIADIEAGLAPPQLRVGNLDAERDFLDVGDVCDAYLALIAGASAGGRDLVNVASGSATRIGDLLEQMRALSSATFEIAVDPARLRPSDIPRAAGSPARLQRATGWVPKIAMTTTLQGLLDERRGSTAQRRAS